MNLPNLAALRAFEAAARHSNFSRAADELNLTHGAISHQVRSLEQSLGMQLFARNGRQVTVTPEAARFAQVLACSFVDIAAGLKALRPDAGPKRLTVSAPPSFAARWLAPRLGRFMELHPDMELVLRSSNQLRDLARDGVDVDVAIRFGHSQYPGLQVEHLMSEIYYPVASPRYAGGRLPATPKALARATLLRSVDPWLPWFRAAGLSAPEPAGGLLFDNLSMLIRSAVDGDGVALVRHVVAEQEIASGQLVRLFDISVASANDYNFVYSPGAQAKPQVQAFRAWLLAEVAHFLGVSKSSSE
jgi:LysR family transcriptional regulator, glycine cleavage system transcriptional activator